MYDAANSCIKVGNNLSEVFHCNIGVRQGENLSPVLFAMLINEINNNLSTQYNGVHVNQLYNTDIDLQLKLFTLLYADDTIVLAETERELQSALDAVHEYCNNMQLTVNTQKTKVMIFSRGKVRKHRNVLFGGSILDVTYEYVYLGVNFNYNTSFIKGIERHISRDKRAMFAIVTKSRRLSIPLDILLFDRVVLLVVLYASEIYGHNDSCIKKLEIFQKSLHKKPLKARCTPEKFTNLTNIAKHFFLNHVVKNIVNYQLQKIYLFKIDKYKGFKLRFCDMVSQCAAISVAFTCVLANVQVKLL